MLQGFFNGLRRAFSGGSFVDRVRQLCSANNWRIDSIDEEFVSLIFESNICISVGEVQDGQAMFLHVSRRRMHRDQAAAMAEALKEQNAGLRYCEWSGYMKDGYPRFRIWALADITRIGPATFRDICSEMVRQASLFESFCAKEGLG